MCTMRSTLFFALATVTLWLCCCVLSGASVPVPSESTGNSGIDGAAGMNSPQFLYMSRLHDRLKDAKMEQTSDIKDEQTSGTLIATSFEAVGDIAGTGLNASGFHLQTGNQLVLNFVLPNPGEPIVIQETDLWLFPDSSQLRNNSIMDLTLLVTVELAHATKPRREVISLSWRMDSGCLRLNLTSLSKKIVNNLQKRGLEKTNITVSVEVVAADEPELVQETPLLDADLQEGCSSLYNRSNNTPFLVMKYYDENQLTSLPTPDTSEELSQNRQQQKRESDESGTENDPKPTIGTTDNFRGCGTVPLKVNFTKLYDFVIAPSMVDVRDCYGSCNTGRNGNIFSRHSMIKEKVKLVEGLDSVHRSETCCAPARYSGLDLLIIQENSFSIVHFPDMIVEECQCV